MSEQNANPVELFGMRVAHVGINATDPADALEIAELFSTMMGLPVIETPVSYFNDSLVEIMKQNGRGAKGHIGFAVNDIDAAEKWFAERGLEVTRSRACCCPTAAPNSCTLSASSSASPCTCAATSAQAAIANEKWGKARGLAPFLIPRG